ncbi:MAG TPA: beta-galactosidase trimerization domain-containing protein [Terriglobia bacterium]|nr:beta-galactosidase trimerization domain-containing protein [Terriglobia bacterium]
MIWLFVLAGLMFTSNIAAQSLEINKALVTRNDTLKAILNLPSGLKGEGTLRLVWTDGYDRTVAVEQRRMAVDGNQVPISLPLRRAVALQNFLEAELALGSTTLKTLRTEFIVTPSEPWDDYQVIMYYPYRPDQQAGLRELGVTAGQIQNVASRTADGAAIWWKKDYRFYCDQMADEFYAPYHTPDLDPKDKLMLETKVAYKADRTRKEPFFRKPCFHDPEAESHAIAKIRQVVLAQMRFKPFFYSTDETGVANLIEAWDFCFCPLTLKAMRKWLLSQYGSLQAINQEWGTHFADLQDVTPLTTDEMMKRGDENLSPWADHRTFMNITFSEAAAKASKTVKSIDPGAIAGLVGCQAPSAFGGYDYWLLSQAIDVAEPYNIGCNREIWRSFAPQKPALTTGFGADNMEIWRLWYQALHGDRGVIIYDEENRYLDAAGHPTPLGQMVGPTYRELTGGLGKQLCYMQRVNDPIAVHYSQPSITAHWMIEHRPLGEDWVDKRSRYEYTESKFLRLRQSTIYLLEDNLRQYTFVSYAQLENGDFDKMVAKVMILPQSVAMSETECAALRRFVERGGTLIADCRTALMDSHCKRLPKGQLDDFFGIQRLDRSYAPGPPGLKYVGKERSPQYPLTLADVSTAEPGLKVLSGATVLYRDANGTPAVIVNRHNKGTSIYLNADTTNYHLWRVQPSKGENLRRLINELLNSANLPASYSITHSNGEAVAGVEVHPWQCGNLRILGIHRNYGLMVSELGPADYQKQTALKGPLELRIDFHKEVALYDTRRGIFLGRMRTFLFPLDPIQPTILAILPEPVNDLTINAPREAKGGELVEVNLGLKGPMLGDTHTFRVQFFDPSGRELSMLTSNLAAPGGKVLWELPLAVNLSKGEYSIRVHDITTGSRAEQRLAVN